MKKIKNLSYLALIALTLVLFTKCDENSEQFIVNPPSSFELAALTITDIQLDANNTNNPAATFNWAKAGYDQQTSINYSIEFSSDEAFTNPTVGASITGKNTLTFSVNELNNVVGNAGLPAFNWNSIYVRVVSTIGTQGGAPVNSNTISFNVYPFFNYVFDDYFLVGNATSPGWDNNGNNPYLYRNPENPSEFTYTGYFATGQFKILETKGLWQPQWGTNDGSSIDVNDGSSTDPNTFPSNNNDITASGNYTFTINFSTKSYSFVAHADAAVISPSTVNIDGSASASPIAMSQLAFDSNIWYASGVRLTSGDFQFMADGSGWGSSTEFSGIATAGDRNIPVPVEDDYDVWFNTLTGQYIFIPLNL